MGFSFGVIPFNVFAPFFLSVLFTCLSPPAGGISLKPVPDPDLDVPPYKSPYTSPDIPLDYGKQPKGGCEPEQVMTRRWQHSRME